MVICKPSAFCSIYSIGLWNAEAVSKYLILKLCAYRPT